MTEMDLELIHLLREINPKDDFLLGVMSCAISQEERRKVLDFIKAGDDVDQETVIVLAILIDQEREKNTTVSNDIEFK